MESKTTVQMEVKGVVEYGGVKYSTSTPQPKQKETTTKK